MPELTAPNRFRYAIAGVGDYGNPHLRDSFAPAPPFGKPIPGDVDRTLMLAAAGAAMVIPGVKMEAVTNINHDPFNPSDW